jgi:hypothetical protein
VVELPIRIDGSSGASGCARSNSRHQVGGAREDKAAMRKAALTMVGRKYQEQIEAAVENVPMVTSPEEKDDEPRYTAWLDLPISTREPMTAKDANAARKALIALDDRTLQQRLLGEPPTWRSALAQRNR